MKKFSKNKIALFLACTSILGGKTQAMNTPKSRQSLVAVGGRLIKSQTKDLLIGLKTTN